MKFKYFMFGMIFCFTLFVPIGFWARTTIRPVIKTEYVSKNDSMMIALERRFIEATRSTGSGRAGDTEK